MESLSPFSIIFLCFVVLFLLKFALQSRLGNNMRPRPSATPKDRKIAKRIGIERRTETFPHLLELKEIALCH
jgi:hypothetical protein